MNCIEADNEINSQYQISLQDRFKRIEEKIDRIEKFVFIQPGEYSINTKSCPRCHPKFDEDGIL